MVITRFAPSPTGFLHVGGLRTALFAYLFAKKHGGQFLLRIEDTDRERFVEGGIENILSSLAWAGIVPDSGVLLDSDGVTIKEVGESGPYIQSKRLPIYKEYAAKLIESGHAYYCFCSKERLDELRERQQQNNQPPMYDGYCRDLPFEEVKIKLEEDTAHVVRLRTPREGVTAFDDIIRGRVEFENKLIDDQVLVKSDGFPTYHLANVIDDHLMHITHVIRGEEWVPSTPKHVLLYQFFDWNVPTFAHLPLLVNEQKQKLSKRHGDVSVEDFKEKGYLPEALVNFVAFLGWNPGDEREMFSLKELESEFDLAKAQKAAAVFNREKLNWYNKQYIMHMDTTELAERTKPFFDNAAIDTRGIDLSAVVNLEQGRAETLAGLVDEVAFVFADHLVYEPELLVWRKSTAEDAKEKLAALAEHLKTFEEGEWARAFLEDTIMSWIKEHEWGNGDVLWPMRVALSGKKNSPGPFEIAAALGKEKTYLQRIQEAIKKLQLAHYMATYGIL